MITLVRLLRVVAILVLALLTLSLLMALFRPETGPLEKVVLAAVLVLMPVAAAKVTSLAQRLQRAKRA